MNSIRARLLLWLLSTLALAGAIGAKIQELYPRAQVAIEIEKLARAYPADPQYPKNLVLCLRRSGDEAAAERWQRRADSLVSVLEQAGIRPR